MNSYKEGTKMRAIKISVVMLTAAVLSLTGCNEKPGPKVLAKVNGTPITADDLNFVPKQPHGEKAPDYGPKGIEDVINQELLYQKGIRLGMDQDPSYRRKLVSLNNLPQGAKRLEMARRVFNTQIASKTDISRDEAQAYYQRNAGQIATELHLLMVSFASKGEAEKAQKKLAAGADFAALARPVMKGKPGQQREPWDLGFVKWQQIPVDFLDQIYGLRPGQLSGLLGTPRTGFQIVKLVERRQLPEPGFDKVSAMLMNQLRDAKLLKEYREYLEALRKEANIVTF